MIFRLLKFFVFIILASTATAQVGIQVPAGHTVKIDAHGTCRQVTNPSSGTRVVFTGTTAEWNSFINYPNGLTLTTCTVPCYHNGQIYQEGQKATFHQYPAKGGANGQCMGPTQKTCQNGVFVSSSSFYDSYIYETCTWLPKTWSTRRSTCIGAKPPPCPAGTTAYHTTPCSNVGQQCSRDGFSCSGNPGWHIMECVQW